jgi:hypothetical protein
MKNSSPLFPLIYQRREEKRREEKRREGNLRYSLVF